MKISIIMAVYNASKFIEHSLLSAIKQDYRDKEIIVIDGASTDGTQSIIEHYRNKIAYYISEPDKGIYDAYNKGIKAASGDIICFLNAGDYYANSHVVTDVATNIDEQDDLYAADVLIDIGRRWMRLHSHLDLKKMYGQGSIYAPATFIRKDVYDKVGLYSEEYASSGDYEFWLRVYTNGVKMHFEDQIMVLMDGTGISSDPRKYGFKENRMIQIKYGVPEIQATLQYWKNMFVHTCIRCLRTLGIEQFIRKMLKPSSYGLTEEELLNMGINIKTLWFI